MSDENCQQSWVDWGVYPRQHYDARLVRSCKKGVDIWSDPGGDKHWEEPINFCYDNGFQTVCRNVDGMKSGAGVGITDNLTYLSDQDFADTADCAYTSATSIPSRASMYVKIRTQYQAGAIKYNDGGLPYSPSS